MISRKRFLMVAAAHLLEHVSLDRNVLGTAKGPWLIHVNAVLTAKESDNASLQLVLENLSDEAHSENRRLYLVVAVSHLEIPQEASRSPIAFVVGSRPRQGMGSWTWQEAGVAVVSGRTDEAPRGKERDGVGFGPPQGDGGSPTSKTKFTRMLSV
jgi:hypothetical protein